MQRKQRLCPWLAPGLAALSTLLALPAYAQHAGTLTGTVTDAADHRPLPDVIVTATSPALQGEQSVVTDSSGSYRVSQLPPGDYTVRLEKGSYKVFSSGRISLRVNSTIRINVTLLPTALTADEVEVKVPPPTVDVGSPTTGVTLEQDFIRRLPLNPPGTRAGAVRSFENLAVVAPGARDDDFGVSISGATSNENRYQIDGLSVNNTVSGVNDTPLPAEFVKEIHVATGGYMPEFGRATGGVVDVVTKSGSNELHGSVFSSITPGAFQGPRQLVNRQGTSIQMDSTLSSLRDVGFEIGGPILKDRLWFYAGLSAAMQDNQITRRVNRLLYETGPDGSIRRDEAGNPVPLLDDSGFQRVAPIAGAEKKAFASRNSALYLGKLTWQIRPEHTLTLSAYGAPSTSGGDGKYSLDPESGRNYFGLSGSIGPGDYGGHARKETSVIHDTALKLASAFMDRRLLLDVGLGWHYAEFNVVPVDGSSLGSGEGLSAVPGVLWSRGAPAHPVTDFLPLPAGSGCEPKGTGSEPPDQRREVISCPVASYRTGGPGYISNTVQQRLQGNVAVTYFLSALGHHVIKAGLDVEATTQDLAHANSGGIWFYEDYGGDFFYVFRFGSTVSPDQVYVSKVRRLSATSTLVGGFVQDSWNILDEVTLNVGARYDTQVISTSDGTGMALPSQWSPRVGAVYDFTRAGRSKVFASFARYYENVPLGIAGSMVAQPLTVSLVGKDACDPRDPGSRAACEAPENRLNHGAPYEPNRQWIVFGGNRAPVDPELEAQSSDEIALGGEYEVFEGARVGLSYMHRYLNNVIEDMSRDEGTTYFIGNPGYRAASRFPKARRDYDALTLSFQKSFSSHWLAAASYTLSSLRGNYNGLFTPGSDYTAPNRTSAFDVLALVPNTDGPLPGDHTHAIKLYGAAEISPLPSLITSVGVSYQALSGGPLNVLSGSPLFGGGGGAFILPRGEGGRLPWVHTVDTNVTVGYRLAGSSVLSVSLDVFNLFNFQEVTSRDEVYTTVAVRPIAGGKLADLPGKLVDYETGQPITGDIESKNFGRPTSYQAPRQVRLGARVTF